MADNQQKKQKKHAQQASEIKEAIPPHILNIVQGVDKKSKNRKKEQAAKKQQSMDSIALIRNMMSSVRTKYELSEAAEEVRKDKEQDSKMINNARDIFKNLENADEPVVTNTNEKVRRIEIKPDFLLEGQNKAEQIRQERIKEMNAMKVARERQIEEEERFRMQERNQADELRKQREIEMEMMRLARQQAMEEEEQYQIEMANKKFVREISPGLAAAKQAARYEQNQREEIDNVSRMKQERENEIADLRRQRLMQLEEQENIRINQEKFQQNEINKKQRQRPKPKKISENWMIQDEESKVDDIRREREMELEMMLNARNQAFEEEEEERLAIEAQRREEAEKKGKEMAALVAELQRMRNETLEQADTDERMTRYQEEMLQRVIELKAIAQGAYMTE